MQVRYHRGDVAEAWLSELKAVQLVAMVKRRYLYVGKGQWQTLIYKQLRTNRTGQFGQSGRNESYPLFFIFKRRGGAGIDHSTIPRYHRNQRSAPAPDATTTTLDKGSFSSRQSLPRWWKSDEDFISHNRCKPSWYFTFDAWVSTLSFFIITENGV